METTPDRLRAFGLSVGLHALVFAVLYFGWKMQPELRLADAGGPAIEATLVSAPSHAAAVSHAVQPKPRPLPTVAPPPTPAPQDSPQPRQVVPQTQVPKPDTVDQDEVRRNAQLAAEQQRKEQEERHRQAQVDLDRQKEQLQAENRQRQAKQDLEKQLAQIRQERADAERQVKLQEQKLKQIEDRKAILKQDAAPAASAATPHPAPGSNSSEAGLLAKYMQAIKDTANQNWIHPDSLPEQVHCRISFTQIPGGEVTNVRYVDCPSDASVRESVDRALHKTPLPYAGFESVFRYAREGELDFCYPTEKCTK